MHIITAFLRFWYDFLVGDAWEIAAGIVLVLGVGALLARADLLTEQDLTLLIGAGIVLVVGISLYVEARRHARAG
jgi:hypothetical protein